MKSIFRILLVLLAFMPFTSCKNNTKPAQQAQMPAPVISAQDNKKIIEREISMWEFAKIKNLPALREIIGDDYVGFFGRNVMHANDVVRLFQTSIVRSYHLSNIRIQPVTNNVAIIYYELNQDILDANGDTWTPAVAAASTYVKRNGVWYSVFYQETVLNN